METEIIIALILTILILLFSGMGQAGKFRKKESRLNATVIRLKSELSDLKSLFDLRTKQHKQFQQKVQTNEASLALPTEAPPVYNEPPPELFNENAYWKALSIWYRKEQGWICEECGINLKAQTGFLHVHHIHGKRYNAPEYLIALCVSCHSNQIQPTDHSFMKNTQEYQNFMKWKGNTHRT